VLVLAFVDTWTGTLQFLVIFYLYHGIAASDPALYNPYMASHFYLSRIGDGLAFPIFSDIIGGPFVGVFCGWITREIANNNAVLSHWRVIARTGLRLFSLGLVAAVAVAGIYIIFVHPRTQKVALTIRKQHEMRLTYGTRPDLPISELWQVPLADAHISLGWNLGINMQSPAPIMGRVTAVRDCHSPREAAQAADAYVVSSSAAPVDLNGISMNFSGGLQTLDVLLDQKSSRQSGTLSVAHGTNVRVTPRSGKPGRSFGFNGDASLSFPVTPGTVVVVSTTDIGGSAGVAMDTTDGLLAFRYAEPNEGEAHCRQVNLSEVDNETKPGPPSWVATDNIVIEVVSDQTGASTSIRISNATLELPLATGFAHQATPPGLGTTFVSMFQVGVDDGTLVVGTDQYPLAPDYQVTIVGPRISIEDRDDEALIVAKGDLPYVVLNGRALTKALFWYLSPELEALVLGGLATGIAFVVRRWWTPIKSRLLF